MFGDVRYLEELSQRYKKKMEEMYSSLDFAIEKLAATAKSAEERVSYKFTLPALI